MRACVRVPNHTRAGHERNVNSALMQVAMIAASCTSPADPEPVSSGGGWSCMLLLHPVSTCPDASPDLCTLHPDLYTLCLRRLPPTATYVVVFLPRLLAQRLHLLHPLQLATVVFPSTSWSRYQTYSRATCTVWWWFLLMMVVVDVYSYIRVSDGGGCSYGVVVVGKCTGAIQRRY